MKNRMRKNVLSLLLCLLVLAYSFIGCGSAIESTQPEAATRKYLTSYHDAHKCLAPEQFGAAGDGVADDTDAVNTAILKASETWGHVCFDGMKHYRCDGTVQLASNVELDMNGCSMTVHEIIAFDNEEPAKAYDGFHDIVVRDGVFHTTNSFAIAHVKNLSLENCTFLRCSGNHFIEMCASQNITIQNCRFLGQITESGSREMLQFDVCEPGSFRHYSDKNSVAYDYTPLDHVVIEGCYFSSYQEGDTCYPMHCAIGGHMCNPEQNTDLTIRNCYINVSDANGIFLNNWDQVLIEGCTLANINNQPIGMRYSCNEIDIRQNTFHHYGSEFAISVIYKDYVKSNITITCNFFSPKGGIVDIREGRNLTIAGNYCVATYRMIQSLECEDCYIKNNFSL